MRNLMEITLKLSLADPTPGKNFMARFVEMSDENPMGDNSRILDGCVIKCSPFDGAIYLSDIRAMSPQNGAGTTAMNTLCGLADEAAVEMMLIAKGYDDTPTSVLVKWYARFGFVAGMGSDEDGWKMIRQPSTKIKLKGFSRLH